MSDGEICIAPTSPTVPDPGTLTCELPANSSEEAASFSSPSQVEGPWVAVRGRTGWARSCPRCATSIRLE